MFAGCLSTITDPSLAASQFITPGDAMSAISHSQTLVSPPVFPDAVNLFYHPVYVTPTRFLIRPRLYPNPDCNLGLGISIYIRKVSVSSPSPIGVVHKMIAVLSFLSGYPVLVHVCVMEKERQVVSWVKCFLIIVSSLIGRPTLSSPPQINIQPSCVGFEVTVQFSPFFEHPPAGTSLRTSPLSFHLLHCRCNAQHIFSSFS